MPRHPRLCIPKLSGSPIVVLALVLLAGIGRALVTEGALVSAAEATQLALIRGGAGPAPEQAR